MIQGNYVFPRKPHTIFIDEVQDLQPAIIFLLTLITKKQIIFCGDTAQTIAKGINFRFTDLKKLFFHGKELIQTNFNKQQFNRKQEFPMFSQELKFKILNVKLPKKI